MPGYLACWHTPHCQTHPNQVLDADSRLDWSRKVSSHSKTTCQYEIVSIYTTKGTECFPALCQVCPIRQNFQVQIGTPVDWEDNRHSFSHIRQVSCQVQEHRDWAGQHGRATSCVSTLIYTWEAWWHLSLPCGCRRRGGIPGRAQQVDLAPLCWMLEIALPLALDSLDP